MDKKDRTARAEYVIQVLEKVYPDARCSLEYKEPYQLLIATRLSAQCTDARVNMVTPALFERFPSIEAFAEADVEEIEKYIRSCGLFHTKAVNIRDMCRALAKMCGVLPDTVEELTKLPGVGRKTANLIVGDVYGKPAVVCDTHCIRICRRLGLTTSDDPLRTEKELREILPPDKSSDLCHRLVNFGRDTCKARDPSCKDCPLRDKPDGYVCRLK